MLAEAILHQPTRSFVVPLSPQEVHIRIRAKRGEVKEGLLHYWNRYRKADTGELQSRLNCFARDDLFDHFETVVRTPEVARYIKYYFRLSGERETLYVGPRGISQQKPEHNFFEFLGVNERDILSVPGWTKGAVFYQIFPDRFCNADLESDPPNVEPWDAQPTHGNFFGGDLKGILSKLDYLHGLGVTALYLNPLFASVSNHKYDTTDYFQIDSGLGTKEDLQELVRQCHERNMRIILDGVFNHCGFHFAPFQDLLRNGKSSRYRDWFNVRGFPIETDPPNYECVGYYKWMPKLRTANPEVREFLIGVARYWIQEAGIDGWRLDVADEVEHQFWQELRLELKDSNSEIFLLGETWQEAPDMLRGDQMDSVMNYPFTNLAADFFARGAITASEFDAGINRLLALYPREVTAILYNLLDSHDTARFLRQCSDDVRRFKLAVAFQMMFPGIPAVYYGDEIGMTDGTDPECRRAMAWDADRQNGDISSWFRRLIALRKSRPCLSHGDFRSILYDDQKSTYGFRRQYGRESIVVVLNNSEQECMVAVPLCGCATGSRYRDLLSGMEYQAVEFTADQHTSFFNHDILPYDGYVTITLPGFSIYVLAEED